MRGSVTKVTGRNPGMASPHRVPSAANLRGQVAKASSTKTSSAGGFLASRKKGSVRGSHVA